MQESYQEIRKKCIKENIPLYHPIISFVSFNGKKCYCEEHPEMVNMNLGAIKQHIEGSDHNLNFETGESLDTSNFENNSKALDKKSSLNKNLTKSSDEYNLKKFMISHEKNPVLVWYMTYHLFEGKQRDEEIIKFLGLDEKVNFKMDREYLSKLYGFVTDRLSKDLTGMYNHWLVYHKQELKSKF